MIKEITMPAGGQTTDCSVIGTWLVKKGDKVKRGDVLLEIETDKAVLPVESYATGVVLAILASEGDEKKSGDVIALIGDEKDIEEAEKRVRQIENNDRDSGECESAETGADSTFSLEKEAEYQPVDNNLPRIWENTFKDLDRSREGVFNDVCLAMPNAKKLARENHISLNDVAKYTGEKVLKRRDVERYMAFLSSEKEAGEEMNLEDEVLKHSTMRKVIARRMAESVKTIPAFTAMIEVEMSACIMLRKTINKTENIKVSYNDILFKCLEASIRKYPLINSSYTDEATIVHKDVNIGLAVSVKEGLVVPVVKNVDRKTIREISVCNQNNIEKARNGKLMPEEISGGTITLTSLGTYPVHQFQAIINPPEACIIAVAAIQDKPVFREGVWENIQVMNITGSFDHRIIDGAYAAQFLAEFKKLIENPALALL